jgi:Resolvase, N terminal domain
MTTTDYLIERNGFWVRIHAVTADFERSLIRKRTKAGLAAARSRGVRLGRQWFNVDSVAQHHIEAYRNGKFIGGIAKLAQLLGCSTGKAHALVKSSIGTTLGVDSGLLHRSEWRAHKLTYI